MKHAVVLLSGGLDSTTTLAIARSQEYETYVLSFDYGQRHARELEAARKIAKSLGAREHRIVKIDNRIFVGSALTDGMLISAGIRGLLNFAPVSLTVPKGVAVNTVDVAVQLEQLAFQVTFLE